MRWLFKIGVWFGLVIYLVVVLGLVTDKERNISCQTLSVEIIDSSQNKFITDHELYNYVLNHDKKLLGKSLGQINTDQFEKMVASIPFVGRVEVFKTLDGKLHVSVSQREPVLHVILPEGRNYYVDNEGVIMPESALYTDRTVIVNGSFLSGARPGYNLKDPEMKNFRTLKKVWILACYIHKDIFWKAQIEQIWVSESGDFILVPRVGAQTILFGNLQDYETKFKNLKMLYQQGFAREEWNKYKQINLKYTNQVVCVLK